MVTIGSAHLTPPPFVTVENKKEKSFSIQYSLHLPVPFNYSLTQRILPCLCIKHYTHPYMGNSTSHEPLNIHSYTTSSQIPLEIIFKAGTSRVMISLIRILSQQFIEIWIFENLHYYNNLATFCWLTTFQLQYSNWRTKRRRRLNFFLCIYKYNF